MIFLIRIILVSFIIILLVRAFNQYNQPPPENNPDHDNNSGSGGRNIKGKKISKEIGEYIDYKEIDKKR